MVFSKTTLVISFVVILITLGYCMRADSAPGTLARSPVISSATAPHNLMFMLDNSGSMLAIVDEKPYNPNVNYGDCPTANIIDMRAQSSDTFGKYVTFTVSGGKPKLSQCSNSNCSKISSVSWGLGNGQVCFDKTLTYPARLNTAEYATSGTYSGNYLNYYFNATNDTTWSTRKPGARSRQEVQQNVVGQMINSLENIRVGLSKFLTVLVGVDNIETNRSLLLSTLPQVDAYGGTPLAVTLHQLGRYFRKGYPDELLTLHPGQTNQTQKLASTVFNDSPTINNDKGNVIQGFCQKNFIVIVTDGDPSVDTNIATSTGLTDYDGDCANIACLPYDVKPDNPYTQPGASDYLDDVAMALYDMDLIPSLKSNTGADVKNNIITYTIGFNVDNQLLKETAAQGGGVYFTANDTAQLLQALQSITADIQAISTSNTSVAIDASSLGVNTGYFQTTYTPGKWIGNLTKRSIDRNGNPGNLLWDAATTISTMTPQQRFIMTYNPDTKQPVQFNLISNLSTQQQNDLNTAPDGSNDGLGQQRINYLLGDRSLEGTQFRKRESFLGDIVDSNPVYVGSPGSGWPDIAPFPTGTAAYSSYVKNFTNRREMVYVSNNNPGSLQAYDTNTGALLGEYIPNALFSTTAQYGLHYLTDPAYIHRFYADGSIAVQDAYTAVTSGGSQSWNTILVSGLNAGGKGYYALNINSPQNFIDKNLQNLFMWEFSDNDNANMGYSFGKPVIGMMNNGRFAVIVPNGFNNSGSQTAVAYILFMDGGLKKTWSLGTDYLAFDTKVGTASLNNGASSITAIDLDGNGTIDRIYMGDILGNVWVIDVSSTSSTNWKFAYGNATTPLALFSAGKPITGNMQIVKNPKVSDSTSNYPNVLVMFGTGQLLTLNDKTDTSLQNFFTVWDSGKPSLTSSNLLKQNYILSNTQDRILDSQAVPYTTTTPKYGCYIDLLQSGERVITEPLVFGKTVLFTSIIPTTPQLCISEGSSWLYALNIDNCGQTQVPIIDINNDSKVDKTDVINNSPVSAIAFDKTMLLQPIYRSGYLIIPDTSGGLNTIRISADYDKTGRISWGDLRTTDPDLSQ